MDRNRSHVLLDSNFGLPRLDYNFGLIRLDTNFGPFGASEKKGEDDESTGQAIVGVN